MAIFFPFNFCFSLNSTSFLLYFTILVIIGPSYLPEFLGFPMRIFLTISLLIITKSICSWIVLIHSSLVFSCFFSGLPCSSKQLCIDYCSYFSTASFWSSTFCANLKIFWVFSLFPFLLVCIKHIDNKIHTPAKLLQITFA